MHITGLIDYLQVVEEQVRVGQFKDQLLHLKAQIQHSGWVLHAHTNTHTKVC